jgi:hypothetical protein
MLFIESMAVEIDCETCVVIEATRLLASLMTLNAPHDLQELCGVSAFCSGSSGVAACSCGGEGVFSCEISVFFFGGSVNL